jgi:hypothetical protein
MSALARVGSAIAQWFYRDTCCVRGQFTGADGSVGTIKFKGLATITRSGEGTYVFKLLQSDGTTVLKGYHLKSFHIFAINPTSTDGLGKGAYIVTDDSINTAGTINFTTFNAAGNAADVIAVAKVAVEVSVEAAS